MGNNVRRGRGGSILDRIVLSPQDRAVSLQDTISQSPRSPGFDPYHDMDKYPFFVHIGDIVPCFGVDR